MYMWQLSTYENQIFLEHVNMRQVFENRSNYSHTQGWESRQVLQDLEGDQIAPMFQQTFYNDST